jgi:hypothetical protein
MKRDFEILKAIAAGIVCGALLIVSIAIACSARHYQLAGQPMPNGKGGVMSFRSGYYISFVCFVMSIAWFLQARKNWRSGSIPDPNAHTEESKNASEPKANDDNR